jgi:hypothetical protein
MCVSERNKCVLVREINVLVREINVLHSSAPLHDDPSPEYVH